ncbi:MAG: response regulator transcription factor [Synergistales bacterium]|nr:response regulator transcription factor [Synergistales bacterium]MDY6402308.1 response regulator transcription factor [Synergistales bacterium]MDY6405501.1 response regulator transcription factor [Synergistales bacterium]MDY6409855.1 response regulator transcription factor [Synergistales bacterium]MDY6414435.1 response regulator transcription factor [Synergistales bacterium]
MKILIVEDEASIAEVVSAYAKRESYETVIASDGLEALEIFERDEIDLVILDLMLPKLNGEEVCRRIREKSSSVPIIMLTAKSSEADVVYGLDTGANDYVSKPFSPRVLMARIRAQMRPKETRDNIASGLYADGRIEIDPERVEIRKDGVTIPVTRSEFLIFSTLVSRPVRTWSREEIIRTALGEDYDGFDRTIDTYIKNLRKKLAEPGHENGWIKTVYGFGYRFDDEK